MEKKSSQDSFLTTTRKDLLWYSLVASQLSVSGGIMAVVSGVDSYGLALILAPITSVVGICCFLSLFSRISRKGKVSYSRLNLTDTNSRYSFPFFLTFSTSLIYLFLLGWEIYVGSRLLASLMNAKTPEYWAVLLGATVLIYTFKASYTRVVVTDRIQSWFIFGLLFMLLVVNFPYFSLDSFDQQLKLENMDWQFILPFFTSITLVNLSAQLQSPQNWQLAQSLSGVDVWKLGLKSGVTLLFVWALIIGIAFLNPPSENGDWSRILGSNEGFFTTTLLFLGVTMMMMSTMDSAMMGIVNSIIACQSGLSEKASLVSSSKLKIRILSLLVVVIAMSVSFGLMKSNPEIFFALISMSGTLSVYSGYLIYLLVGKEHLLSKSRFMPRLIFFVFLALVLIQVLGLMYPDSVKFGFSPIIIGFLMGLVIPNKYFFRFDF